MNFKAVLKGLESFATAVVPGAAGVDAAVHGIIDAKGGSAKEAAAVQALLASVQMLEAMGTDFASEPDFQSGVLQIQSGAVMIMKAVNAKHSVTPK